MPERRPSSRPQAGLRVRTHGEKWINKTTKLCMSDTLVSRKGKTTYKNKLLILVVFQLLQHKQQFEYFYTYCDYKTEDLCDFHPQQGFAGVLELIPADTGREAGYTPGTVSSLSQGSSLLCLTTTETETDNRDRQPFTLIFIPMGN